MDGRGGYAGGDGEKDWGEVEEKKQKNIERFECGRDVFGRGCFSPLFVENWDNFDRSDKWMSSYCIICNMES